MEPSASQARRATGGSPLRVGVLSVLVVWVLGGFLEAIAERIWVALVADKMYRLWLGLMDVPTLVLFLLNLLVYGACGFSVYWLARKEGPVRWLVFAAVLASYLAARELRGAWVVGSYWPLLLRNGLDVLAPGFGVLLGGVLARVTLRRVDRGATENPETP